MQKKPGEDTAERGVVRVGSHRPREPGEAAGEPLTPASLRDADKCCWTVLYLLNIAKFTFSTSDTKCMGFPHQAPFQCSVGTS